MREAAFQRYVIDTARAFGWRVWHVPAPMRNVGARGWVGAKEAAGLPDLICLHLEPPRVLFVEVKGEGGKPSAKQIEFLKLARDIGLAGADLTGEEGMVEVVVGAFCWRPGDEEQVETVLRSGAVY